MYYIPINYKHSNRLKVTEPANKGAMRLKYEHIMFQYDIFYPHAVSL